MTESWDEMWRRPYVPPDQHKEIVGSYTLLNAYKNCPHQMYRRYIAKDLGPFVETEATAFGNAVHKAFEDRIRARKPLPANMQQWEQFALPFDGRRVLVEEKLGMTADGRACDFWDQNCFFRGKGDAIILGDRLAFIGDFKSGSSKYEDPLELATQAMLLRAKYPALDLIKGSYIWLKENRVGQDYDLSDTASTFAYVTEAMDEIKDTHFAEFEKRRSGLCSWCNVKDCEHWRER